VLAVLGLGYFDDADPDDALPLPRAHIVDYWTRRQREIVAARGRLPRCTNPQPKPGHRIGIGNLCRYRLHGGGCRHRQDGHFDSHIDDRSV
jgi:hypothetical protein